jgi:hypothetical protein
MQFQAPKRRVKRVALRHALVAKENPNTRPNAKYGGRAPGSAALIIPFKQCLFYDQVDPRAQGFAG